LKPLFKLLPALILLLFAQNLWAKIDISSVRVNLTRPATAHNLVLQNPNGQNTTTFFDLEPKNNERLGVFVKVNSLLIGYSLDLFQADEETKTTHIDIITEKYDFSRVGFNIQILKGFESESRSFETNQRDSRFAPDIESQRFELFGKHNLKTYYGKSLFNHFFLNRPVEGANVFGLSLVGDWTLRHLKLSSKNGVIYTPDFFNSQITDLATEIRALSVSAGAGPMISLGLKNRFNMFLSSSLGAGYFDNLTGTTDLKESGFEFLQSYSGGLSWNSKNKKYMVSSKVSYQKGRHIETTFGDLMFLYFF